VPGVRLYLSNGQSVITDSAGLYNFPSLGDGPQVISLDPISIPKFYSLADGDRVSGKSWARLLRNQLAAAHFCGKILHCWIGASAGRIK